MLASYGKEDLAKVFVASMRGDPRYLVEFVESVQPPIPRDKKWVLILSSSFGCQMRCLMCDAGGEYYGKLTKEEILSQVEYMVRRRFPDRRIPVPKFKVQFARMGEPTLNPAVLDVLRELPQRYEAPGLMPCISTLAPHGSQPFLEELIDIKNRLYSKGRFQMQFSIHTTDTKKRDVLMPCKKWGFKEISEFGERFFRKGDRKIALNFAMARGFPVEARIIREFFDPSIFLVKLTPLNPTESVHNHRLESAIDPYDLEPTKGTIREFESHGFDVILSIGELEENKIGSNCGQFISVPKESGPKIRDGYRSAYYQTS
ncbi:MAG: radical SAM protein [Thermoplasmata archaeon]